MELLPSESPSGKCAKLHTVSASNKRSDHFIIACSCHIYMGIILRTHSVRGELRIQRNASGVVATTSPLIYTNRTDRTFFLWSLHLAGPSHPSHSTSLLWLESLSGNHKLRTVAPSNNRDHPMRSLCYFMFAPHVYGCYSSHTFRSWWTANGLGGIKS